MSDDPPKKEELKEWLADLTAAEARVKSDITALTAKLDGASSVQAAKLEERLTALQTKLDKTENDRAALQVELEKLKTPAPKDPPPKLADPQADPPKTSDKDPPKDPPPAPKSRRDLKNLKGWL